MAQTGDVSNGKARRRPVDGRHGRVGPARPPGRVLDDTRSSAASSAWPARRTPNSANSQFFIMFAPAPNLDGQYTVVGNVVQGLDVVDAIKRGNSAANGAVAEPDYMARVTVTQ